MNALGKAEERGFICRRVKLNALTGELWHLHLTIIGLQNVVKKGDMLQPISCFHAGRCLTNLHRSMVSVPPEPGKVKLLDRVREAMRFKHYSLRTERTYIDWIKRFIIYHGKRHPETMGADEVRRFLNNLASERNVAASTQNQAFSALLFLYKEVLKQQLPWIDDIQRAKRPAKMPLVFTPTEARDVLGKMHGTARLMAQMLYGHVKASLTCCGEVGYRDVLRLCPTFGQG